MQRGEYGRYGWVAMRVCVIIIVAWIRTKINVDMLIHCLALGNRNTSRRQCWRRLLLFGEMKLIVKHIVYICKVITVISTYLISVYTYFVIMRVLLSLRKKAFNSSNQNNNLIKSDRLTMKIMQKCILKLNNYGKPKSMGIKLNILYNNMTIVQNTLQNIAKLW